MNEFNVLVILNKHENLKKQIKKTKEAYRHY